MRYLLAVVSVLALFGFSSTCLSQDRDRIDSLKNGLNTAENDSLKLDILAHLFTAYSTFDLDSAAVYSQHFLKSAKAQKDALRLHEAHLYISRYYWMKGMADSVKLHTEKCIEYATALNDQIRISDAYRRLSMLHDYQGNIDSSILYAQKSSDIATQTSDWDLQSRTILREGNLYYRTRDYPNAISSYQKVDSIITANEVENDYLGSALLNIALIYTYLKSNKAPNYYHRALELYDNIGNAEGLNDVKLRFAEYERNHDLGKALKLGRDAYLFYQNHGHVVKASQAGETLARIYLRKEKPDSAFLLYKAANEYALQSGHVDQIAKSYIGLGDYYSFVKDYYKAIDFYQKAEEKFSEIGKQFTLHEKIAIYEDMASAYLGIKDYEKAYHYLNKFMVWRDSLTAATNNALVEELESRYQSEKKQREIDELTAKNMLAQKEKEQQFYLLSGIALLVLIVAIFFYLLFRNRQKTATKLKELGEMKSHFFANISHEFRTPLTLIKSPVEKQLAQPDLTTERQADLSTISRNADRLLALVDQLLDLSKLESGQVQLQIIQADLPRDIRAMASAFKYLAEQKGIKYTCSIPARTNLCWYDQDVVEKITVNLLSNAIKYTEEGGQVEVVAVVSNTNLELSVKNTGQGINKKEIVRVLDRFYQSDASHEGVGIGLALVNELTTLHQGRLTYSSKENGWTIFTVTLPVDKESFSTSDFATSDSKELNERGVKTVSLPSFPDSEQLNEQNGNDATHPVLLVIDDNADIRALIKSLFDVEYQVLEADNGRVGIETAVQAIPDMIISDVMMPGIDGVELAATLKQDERTSHIPIILLTAKAGEAHEIAGLETGADDYVVKPFSNELLRVRVKKLIELREQLHRRYSRELVLKPNEVALTSTDEKFLQRVQELFDERLTDSQFNAQVFSREIGMSRMQLHRKLKALTGHATSELIRSQRLKTAAQLLQKGGVNMSEIGYSVGFNDPSYFSKCFKEFYGYSPSEYAESHSSV